MRLADFIENNSEVILNEWVAFAATTGAAGKAMDRAELRDHAGAMLTTIVAGCSLMSVRSRMPVACER